MLRLVIVSLIAASAWSCAKKPPKDFVQADLAGVINGRDWAYRHAYVDPTIETPEEEDVVFVFLPFKPKDGCPAKTEAAADPRTVMVSAPKARSLVKLKGGTSRNLVFHFEKKGQHHAAVAKSGKIKLTEIGDRVLTGRIHGTFNDANWVSGNFSAVVCDYEAFR